LRIPPLSVQMDLRNRSLADLVAEQIPSPVRRLRFLLAVMPTGPEKDHPPRRSFKLWYLVSFLVVALLFAVPRMIPRARAAGKLPILSVLSLSRTTTVRVEQTTEIWQVEKTSAFDTYSNGLRIENRFAVANHPRSYLAFSATRPDDVQGERRSVPAGIVFHTTESLQAPFESRENTTLKRIGESLLIYVRSKRAYNFVIDRFGRVYRIVQETDAANHAGHSIWADPERVYVNLNESFLGVSFETKTSLGQTEAVINPAQVRSAALLTDMLRKRYGISAGDCITHAQVSVNASQLRIGYHVDWASSFPFDQLGLPDNYALALPSVSLFGFDYDSTFARQAGPRVYQEAELGEQVLRNDAGAAQLEVPVYRAVLQTRYRSRLAAVRHGVNRADEEE
jgi:hypothetical protein